MTHNEKIHIIIHYDESDNANSNNNTNNSQTITNAVDDNSIMSREEMDYYSDLNAFINELPSSLYNQRSKIYNFEKQYIQDTHSSLYVLSYIACQYYFKKE
jgi:hypothetical protein